MYDVGRRRFMRAVAGFGSTMAFAPVLTLAGSSVVNKKPIPATGEEVPIIGMGTWQTFDVGGDEKARSNLTRVLQAFFDHGGGVIDSSPMYGSSEQVVGDLLNEVGGKEALFAATKVWTRGRQAGIDQMRRSMQRMGVGVFDLMQIHNLVDWETHWETLKTWKAEGKVRYVGITTSHGRAHSELEQILATQPFDFVQFTYSLANRTVEERLLPIAQERGVATLINRPYQGGSLFRRVKGKPLPAWAGEFDCESWGQFFLKFVVSHPAVTCAIPATSKVRHMVDNMQAGAGRLPDAKTREKMRAYFESI
ncbi:MAG: aldo/keto reductase [Gammaproteobacteria bacterium]|nr:aldo/keto reductase [Gammaproteobacteria bacterium]